MPTDFPGHTIGSLRFASDGTLFVTNGDGANPAFADVNALRAQNLDSLAGKILRINPNGSAPSDNPFYNGNPNAIRSKVWAYGIRQPFRIALDPDSGDLYVGDVGWNTWEEINRVVKGGNYGWPCYEGGSSGSAPQPQFQAGFAQCQGLPPSAVKPPLYAYGRTEGTAVVGGTFYSGTAYPEQYRGNLFFADYSGEWIRRMIFAPDKSIASVELFATGLGPGTGGPVDLQVGPDGLLYYIVFTRGEVRRFRYGGPTAVASGNPTSGYAPLNVQFDGSESSGPEGSPLTSYLWEFGDGASSTLVAPVHQYNPSAVTTYSARLTVTDSTGATDSAVVPITVGSTPPQPTISTPADGTDLGIGQVVNFQGSAVDADQGLPASALKWTVLLHHNTHVHVALEVTGSGGSFTVEDHGAGTFSYEIILSVTDSSGLTGSTSVSLPVTP
jgi:PKD repeat protein